MDNNEDKINLLDYQILHYENLKKSINKYSRAIDASDTGTGKTYVSIKLCKDLELVPFIICPKSVVSTWERIIKKEIKKYYIITYNKLALLKNLIKNDNKTDDYEWDFESDNRFKKKENFLFIFDEAHKCKNCKTINSKILLSLSKYNVKILLLSATIIDKPLFFIPFGLVLKLYDTLQKGVIWMSNITKNKSSNPVIEIHKILFNNYASRMRIDETVGIFTNNKIFFEGIHMDNYWKIEKKYDKLNLLLEINNKKKNKNIHDVVIEEKDKDNDSNSNSNKNNIKIEYNRGINKIQKLRQDIEFLRVETIYELTLKYLTQGKSVAIFVNFTNTIKELSKRLNCNCIIWGFQNLKERTKCIDDFCLDKSRIIICNIQSGSASISLHDTIGKFPRISIISPTWSAQDLIQVLGRIHRAMGKTDCEQQIIFCKNTIEENVGNIIKQKINNIRFFNDGNKILKNNNMELILNNELIKKKKVQEEKEYIYKINDFDAIQNRIEKLEKEDEKLLEELKSYEINSFEYKECEYKIEKNKKELDFNLLKLNETIEIMMK